MAKKLPPMVKKSPPPLPPDRGNWRPRPTSPWGGLEAFDWKGGKPKSIGTVPVGPTEEDLKMVRRFGRRRLPPELSGVGSEKVKLRKGGMVKKQNRDYCK
jgi:hypothetical protein